MCGINGCIPPSSKIKDMNGALKHRGPDGSGEFHNEEVSLGHTRLSIIDLSENGAQPMGLFSSGNLDQANLEIADFVIVFNGEIYNFKELRSELSLSSLKTTGDTGVILHAYKKWGSSCLEKFNGMFALCIYDKKKKELFLARDRLGQKPLYYFHDGKKFSFSSELKGILKIHKNLSLEKKAVELYFSMGFIPSPLSIFENVFKLEPGHYAIYDIRSKELKKNKYFFFPKLKKPLMKSEAKEKFSALIESAVNYRLIADVPVGAFLSGGVDSSSIVGFIKKKRDLHTFSIGFEGKDYDESPYIHVVCDLFKTQHHHKIYRKKDFKKDIEGYVECYDEPFADYSGFPTRAVSKLAKDQVTVVLSGDGGDEIFGGYPWHSLGRQLDLIRKIPKPIRKIIAKVKSKSSFGLFSPAMFIEACRVSLLPKERFYSAALAKNLYKPKSYANWTETHLRSCLKLSNNNLSEALRLFDLYYHTLADNYLTKVDRASMAYSIEVRSPYLDYRFVFFAQQLKSSWKAGLFSGKLFLKKVLESVLPKNILYRKKQGFSPPLDKWIADSSSRAYVEKAVTYLKEYPEIEMFYREVVFKRSERPYKVYMIRLFLFGKWLERWYL